MVGPLLGHLEIEVGAKGLQIGVLCKELFSLASMPTSLFAIH